MRPREVQRLSQLAGGRAQISPPLGLTTEPMALAPAGSPCVTLPQWSLRSPVPCSVYQVIVQEERPRRLRREPGGQDCFPVPLTFDAALARGLVHYFGAELAASSLPEAMPFTVGDNQTYRGFWNPPLEPRKAYLIYFQATSHLKGVRDRPRSRGSGWGTGWGHLGARLSARPTHTPPGPAPSDPSHPLVSSASYLSPALPICPASPEPRPPDPSLRPSSPTAFLRGFFKKTDSFLSKPPV